MDANRTALEFAGTKSEEVLGKPFWETQWWNHSPEMQKKLKDAVKKAANGEMVRYEANLIAKDDTMRFIDFTLKPVYDENGKVVLLIPEGRDITERKKAEAKLLISEEKFSKLFHSSPHAILLTELKSGKIIEVNNSFEKFSGYSRDELIGNLVLNLNMYSPDERQRFISLFKENGNFHNVEFENKNRAGDKLLVLASAALIQINEEPHAITILYDITERKKSQEELQHSEEKFSKAFQMSPHSMAISGEKDGIYYDVNKAFLSLTGFTREEVVGSNSLDLNLWVDPEIRQKFRVEIEANHEINLYPVSLRMKSGEIRDILYSACEIQIGGKLNTLSIAFDITDRTKAEEALHESEERYRLLVENMPIGMVVSQEDIILYANSTVLTIIKAHNGNDLIGKSVYEFIPLEYKERSQARRNSLSTSSLMSGVEEFKLIRLDQTLVDVEILAVRIIYNGKPAILNLLSDITERKQAEEALKASEERFKELAKLLPQTVFESDLSGNLTYVNQMAFTSFGYTPDDFRKGLNAFNMIIPDERSLATEKLAIILSEKKSSISEYTALRKDNSTFPIVLYTNAIISNSQVIGLRGLIFDITERKLAESAIIKSEERLQKLVNSVTDYIYTVKIENDKVIDTTHGEGCISVTGYTTEEFKSDDYLWFNIIYITDREAVKEQVSRLMQNKEAVPLEHRIIHKNGSIRWVRNTPVLNFNSKNDLISYDGLIADITELKEAQRQILSATIEAEERERNYFAKELHDGLGPLLSSIKLYFQWFNKPELQTPKEELLTNINAVIHEAITSVKEISHKLSPHVLINFGLIYAVKSFIEKLKDTSRINIKLKSNIEQRLDKDIEITLYRVIIECINNTVKYANAKKIIIEIIKKQNQIDFNYTDNGIGFIYDETVKSSKGLGLFNMQNRIEILGGNFEIETHPGKGVKIKVTVNT